MTESKGASLDRVVREGFPEEVIFDLSPEEGGSSCEVPAEEHARQKGWQVQRPWGETEVGMTEQQLEGQSGWTGGQGEMLYEMR